MFSYLPRGECLLEHHLVFGHISFPYSFTILETMSLFCFYARRGNQKQKEKCTFLFSVQIFFFQKSKFVIISRKPWISQHFFPPRGNQRLVLNGPFISVCHWADGKPLKVSQSRRKVYWYYWEAGKVRDWVKPSSAENWDKQSRASAQLWLNS